jgi:hypothetical protein
MIQDTDKASDETELSSPVCYANEADPDYMGYTQRPDVSKAKHRGSRFAALIRRAWGRLLRR